MTLSLFNAIEDIEDIEIFIDCDNKPWFKRAHVGAFLGLEDIRTSVRNLEGDEFRTREQLGVWYNTPGDFKGQYHDVFLSVYGVMHVIINSRKERGKELKEFIFKDIIPRGLKEKIKQLQKDHQLAITDRDNKIKAIQYENVGLQIALCENRTKNLIEKSESDDPNAVHRWCS